MNFSLRLEYVVAILIVWTIGYTIFWGALLYAKGYLGGSRPASSARPSPRSPAVRQPSLDRLGLQEALALRLAQEEQKASAATLRRQLEFLDRALADPEAGAPKS